LSSRFGFNPHPASLPGDAAKTEAMQTRCRVSIRTRHRCRVMQRISPIISTVKVFQSAPGIAAG